MNDIARRTRSHATVAAGGALVGMLAGLLARGGPSAVAAGGVVGATGAAAAVADLRERRIPNEIVFAGLLAAAVLIASTALGGTDPVVPRALGGAVAAGVPLLVVHLVDPDGLGFGDVKLAAVLGGVLGVVSWVLGLLMLAAASVLALAGVAVVRAWRRSIPFGACLAGGAVVVLAVSGRLLDAWGLR